jgi:hypothetical protein
VVSVRLAPRGDNPALQKFKNDPVGHTRKRRARVVKAALTIIEAFRVAGQPLADVPTIGSYEAWSLQCRQPLLWLGEPDPAASVIQQVRNDPDNEMLGAFLSAWFWAFKSRPMTVRQVIEKAADYPSLADTFADLPIMEGRYVNPGRLGWYLKKNCDRRVGEFRLERAECSERRAWRVAVC